MTISFPKMQKLRIWEMGGKNLQFNTKTRGKNLQFSCKTRGKNLQDPGLLVAMLDLDVPKAIIDDNLYINEGELLENVCAEEIVTRYGDLTYFEKRGKLEIDFVMNIGGQATAVEVKSGNTKLAKSLLSIIDNYKTVSRYIMLERDNRIYRDERGIEYYPLFMMMFL